MTRKGQQTVTIPKWVWDLAEKYYEEHEEELQRYGIRSTTGLITRWVQEGFRRGELPEP